MKNLEKEKNINYSEDEIKLMHNIIKNGNANNELLYTLGLEYYVKKDKIEFDSINDLFYLANTQIRKIQHLNNNSFFMSDQFVVLQTIEQQIKNYNIMLTALPSFGKTTIILEYLFKHKNEFNFIAFIIPTNALAYELEKKILKYFPEFNVFDSMKDENDSLDEKNFFIGTPEKLKSFYKFFDKIDILIIDEAYKLSKSDEKDRLITISSVFKDFFNLNKKIILLLPFYKLKIADEKILNSFFTINTNFNPIYTELSTEIIDETNYFRKFLNSKNSIYFCNQIKRIRELSSLLENEDYSKTINDKSIKKIIDFIKNKIYEDYYMVKYLEKGIGVHNGPIPKNMQNKIINLFNSKKLNKLIATQSISEGINSPAENLFFDLKIKKANDQQQRLLFKNTIGRVGRLGYDEIGKVFLSEELNLDLKKEISITLAFEEDDEIKDQIEQKNIDYSIKEKLKEYNILNEENFYACKDLICRSIVNINQFKKICDMLMDKNSLNLEEKGKISINNINKMLSFIFEKKGNYDGITNILFNKTLSQAIKSEIKYAKNRPTFAYNVEQNKIDNMLRVYYNVIPFQLIPITQVFNVLKNIINKNEMNKNSSYFLINNIEKKLYENYFNHERNDSSKNKIIIDLKNLGIDEISSSALEKLYTHLPNHYNQTKLINTIEELSQQDSEWKKIYNEFDFLF